MHVIVRPPGDAFRRAISEHPEHTRIDPVRAARQHAAFVAALEAAGLTVVSLPAEPALADATFVSDTLVALAPAPAARADGGTAASPTATDAPAATAALVVTRPAHASRRLEVPSVEAAACALLPPATPLVRIEGPETLEGGDVIVYGDRIAIGVSRRTSEGGARLLAAAAERLGYRAFLCPVEGRLHLATAVTAAGPDLLIGTAAGFASLDAVDAAPLGEIHRIVLPDEELGGANVLALTGHAFIAAGYPTADHSLREAGLTVHALDLDEFGLADGGPTCLVNVLP